MNEESINLWFIIFSASAISVTFTLLRVLYGDHHSMSREQDLNVGLLRLKQKKTEEFGQLKFSRYVFVFIVTLML